VTGVWRHKVNPATPAENNAGGDQMLQENQHLGKICVIAA
jgi:hypothetical protein